MRTTFTLSKEGYEAIEWLSQNPRRTFKEVLEVLCSELLVGKYEQRRLKAVEPPERSLLSKVMRMVEEVGQDSFDLSVRKTYVIGESFLETFKYLSKSYKIPRDFLVDCALRIQRKKQEKEKEELRANYKEALEIIADCQSVIEDAGPKLIDLLPEDKEIASDIGGIEFTLEQIKLDVFLKLVKIEGLEDELLELAKDTEKKKEK
jgi:hypothetical protein